MEVRYSVDRLLVRSNIIYGFGWIFHHGQQISDLVLDIELGDGSRLSLPTEFGIPSGDAAARFPGVPNALKAGFEVYAEWKGARFKKALLLARLADGTSCRLEVPVIDFAGVSAPAQLAWLRLRLRPLVTLLRTGRFRELAAKVSHVWGIRGKHHVANPVARVAAERTRPGYRRSLLVVCQEMGGGSNHYRNKMIAARRAQGDLVVLFTFSFDALQYALTILGRDTKTEFAVPGPEIIGQLALERLVDEVFLNNAVSYPRPEDLLRKLHSLAEQDAIPLTVAVHDYLPVCPSQFLLDYEARYCDIPDAAVCATCLPRNRHGFSTIHARGDIQSWRRIWASCLTLADRIVCFSPSSERLMRKAYPELPAERFCIEPHRLDHAWSRAPAIRVSDPLHIAVVGTIIFHKGAEVIRDLADEIARRSLPIRITVIGNILTECDPRVVSSTGRYEAATLPDLVEKSGANLFFMPSICPETFSFVTEELIGMKLPVICFDLGAPAERISNYALGRVIKREGPGAILDQIIRFHEDLATMCRTR